jgi:hypothetical protein
MHEDASMRISRTRRRRLRQGALHVKRSCSRRSSSENVQIFRGTRRGKRTDLATLSFGYSYQLTCTRRKPHTETISCRKPCIVKSRNPIPIVCTQREFVRKDTPRAFCITVAQAPSRMTADQLRVDSGAPNWQQPPSPTPPILRGGLAGSGARTQI